jgi:hypothetical protein
MPKPPADNPKKNIAHFVPEDSRKRKPLDPHRIEEVRRHLGLALDLLIELLGNATKAAEWLDAPNDLCFNASPYECIVRGDGEAIINWLRDRTGKSEKIEFDSNCHPEKGHCHLSSKIGQVIAKCRDKGCQFK